MKEGLLRQRRNLIVTCTLLWIITFGGVEFTKISFAGFDVTFENPNALTLSIWIAFWYFLYRYYLYFLDEGIFEFQRIFNAALEQKCRPIIRHLVEKKYPGNIMTEHYSYALLKRNRWIVYGASPNPEGAGSSFETEDFEIAINPWKLWSGILTAIMNSVFRNTVVTDYLLPFVLADFILYYCGTNSWDGSFLRLLALLPE